MDKIKEEAEQTYQALATRGHSFDRALATLIRHSDSSQLRRIKQAFPEYWRPKEKEVNVKEDSGKG